MGEGLGEGARMLRLGLETCMWVLNWYRGVFGVVVVMVMAEFERLELVEDRTQLVLRRHKVEEGEWDGE